MQVTLYRTSDDRKKVTKTLTSISTMSAQATAQCSVLTPRLILGGDSVVNAINANYCYIDTFARYYFIKEHITDTASRIIIDCEYDPLMSYGTQLRATNQLVTRSESVGKPTYITDPTLPLLPDKEMYVAGFEGGYFNLNRATGLSYNFILNVSGGGNE